MAKPHGLVIIDQAGRFAGCHSGYARFRFLADRPVRLPGGYDLMRPRHRPVSVAMRRFRDRILAELDAAAKTGG